MLKSKLSLSRHFEYANKQITYHFWLWITSGFGGGEFTKTLRKVCTCQNYYAPVLTISQNITAVP
jgi:hypothetical protein